MATANPAIQTYSRNLKDPRRAPRHLFIDLIAVCDATDRPHMLIFGP